MAEAAGLVEEAQRIADEVLFPRALETDANDTVPVDLLDLLAHAGLYGLVVPRPLGGLGADARTVGIRMFEAYILPFEMVSILLLAAIVGALLLSSRGAPKTEEAP